MKRSSPDAEYLKRLTVLYVEDEEETREQTAVFLRRIAETVITARDGKEGLAQFHARRPHIVVTDIQMPNMDGLSMAGEIRAADRSVPIVVLTAFEQVGYLRTSINIGVDKYVTKPVDGFKLQETLLDCAHSLLLEETLRKSEAQIRLLLDSTAEAIYGIDPQGVCTFVNPSCLRMLGYAEADQLLGRNMHELIHHSHPDGSPLPADECAICRTCLNGMPLHTDEAVLWKADGTSFPAELWSHPQVVDGQTVGAVMTFIDITERTIITRDRERLVEELQEALASIKTLSGLLPICSFCKKIRDDKGYWNQLENYISNHSEALFSHGICPDCLEKHYPDFKKR